MKKKCPVSNPFSYANEKTMLVWKVAQTCIWMISTLWDNPDDYIRLNDDLANIMDSVAELTAYRKIEEVTA